MKGLLTGVALAVLAAAPAAAQDWRVLMFNGADDRLSINYFDVASVARPTPTTRTFRVANVFEKIRSFSTGRTYQMIQTTYTVDCSSMSGNSLSSSAYNDGVAIVTTTEPGEKTVFDGSSTYRRAALAACSGDTSNIALRAEGTPQQDAVWRFRERSMVRASLNSSNWHRVSVGGPAGAEIAIFVDRSGIVRDPQGRIWAPTMTIEQAIEGADDPQRFHYATRFDCASNMRSNTFAMLYGPNGNLLGSLFANTGSSAMTAGKLIGGLSTVCTGDWTRGRAYPMQPQAVIATAFAR